MAGHSHSANIARRKNAVDAKRAKVFSKCAKAIMSAVRQGGPDEGTNLKLRYAVEKARAANMPKENIERAIKRASGEGQGDLEELFTRTFDMDFLAAHPAPDNVYHYHSTHDPSMVGTVWVLPKADVAPPAS